MPERDEDAPARIERRDDAPEERNPAKLEVTERVAPYSIDDAYRVMAGLPPLDPVQVPTELEFRPGPLTGKTVDLDKDDDEDEDDGPEA